MRWWGYYHLLRPSAANSVSAAAAPSLETINESSVSNRHGIQNKNTKNENENENENNSELVEEWEEQDQWEPLNAGSSTALLAVLTGDRLRVAHVGDCVGWLVRRGEVVWRSEETSGSGEDANLTRM